MKTTSDTPKTDAMCSSFFPGASITTNALCRMADFARDLERENNVLIKERAAYAEVRERVGELTEFISETFPQHAGRYSTTTAISEIKRLMEENAELKDHIKEMGEKE